MWQQIGMDRLQGHTALDPQHRKHAKLVHKGAHGPHHPHHFPPLPNFLQDNGNQYTWNIIEQENNRVYFKISTWRILSNSRLHISSQRFRTVASDTALIPVALADCGRKSSAKFRFIMVTRRWWLGIFLNISTICSVFLATSIGIQLPSATNWVWFPEGSSNQNS